MGRNNPLDSKRAQSASEVRSRPLPASPLHWHPMPALNPLSADQRTVVLEALESGASLRSAAEQANIGSEATIRRWVMKDNHFAAQYTRARDIGLDAVADQVLAIADDQTLDPNSRRVMMDARRWYLSKLAPKRYGERTDINVNVTHEVSMLPTAELERLVSQHATLQLETDGSVTGGGTSDSGEAGE